jgi:hypothetical protein
MFPWVRGCAGPLGCWDGLQWGWSWLAVPTIAFGLVPPAREDRMDSGTSDVGLGGLRHWGLGSQGRAARCVHGPICPTSCRDQAGISGSDFAGTLLIPGVDPWLGSRPRRGPRPLTATGAAEYQSIANKRERFFSSARWGRVGLPSLGPAPSPSSEPRAMELARST